MKKIIPFLIIGILILSGIGAVALPSEKQIENKPLIGQDFELEILVEGGTFGYKVTFTNMGPEPINVSITMNIVTDAWFMFLGGDMISTCPEDGYLGLDPGGYETFDMKPLFGFGPATISISGTVFVDPTEFDFEVETTGFVFLIIVSCEVTPINLP